MNYLTAVINCRASSTRLPFKHIKKIGPKTLIEVIIDQLLKINFINEIYIATGSKKKNYIYEKYLKKKYKKKIKFYYHDNENFVNERIYKLSKKIKNEFILTYSGDCPIVETKFISKVFKLYLTNSQFDYVFLKDNIIEGIDIFRKSLWQKIYNLSKKGKDLRENPAYIIKKKPHLFKKLSLEKFYFSNYIKKNKIRASIDTQSDLDFFNLFFEKVKSFNKFNYKNLYKFKVSKINSHVNQKNLQVEKFKKIYLITHKSKKFGYGHYSRCQTVVREITEHFSEPPFLYQFNSDNTKKIVLSKKYLKLKNIRDSVIIIDVPKKFVNIFLIFHNTNKIIVIDNIVKRKKITSFIPTFRKIEKKKTNIFSGSECLILNRKLNLISMRKKNLKNEIVIFSGSTLIPPKEILHFIEKNSKFNYHFLITKDTPDQFKNYLIKKNFKFSLTPKNFLEIVSSAKAIICRFGVFTLECIKMNKKIFVWKFNESPERLIDINYLQSKKYIKSFNISKFSSELKNYVPKKITLNAGCNKLISLIRQ